MKKLLIVLFLLPIIVYSQLPVIDGNIIEPQYIKIAVRQNANMGWGQIRVDSIYYWPDVQNSNLYLGIVGYLDGSSNGLGVWINVSGPNSPAGKPAGNSLAIINGGHYISGNSGSNPNFKADFEVDYMFAFNAGGGTNCWFDAGKHVPSSVAYYQGNCNLTGTPSTNSAENGTVFTQNSITFAWDNAGGNNQGLEMRIPFSELGATSDMYIEVFAFIVSSTAYFSNMTVPGNCISDPGFNANWGSIPGGPYHSTPPKALPVQLSSFIGYFVNNNSVKLEWETISEKNNFGFYVEKFNSALNSFVAVSDLIPGVGNSIQPQRYSWIDENATDQNLQYRLKQIDNDGLENYYGPIMLNPTSVKDNEIAPAVFKLFQNYPNPFNPKTSIKFSVAKSGFTTLKVYNILGNEVATLYSGNAEPGKYYQVEFDASQLTSGIYFLKLTNSDEVQLGKMILMK